MRSPSGINQVRTSASSVGPADDPPLEGSRRGPRRPAGGLAPCGPRRVGLILLPGARRKSQLKRQLRGPGNYLSVRAAWSCVNVENTCQDSSTAFNGGPPRASLLASDPRSVDPALPRVSTRRLANIAARKGDLYRRLASSSMATRDKRRPVKTLGKPRDPSLAPSGCRDDRSGDRVSARSRVPPDYTAPPETGSYRHLWKETPIQLPRSGRNASGRAPPACLRPHRRRGDGRSPCPDPGSADGRAGRNTGGIRTGGGVVAWFVPKRGPGTASNGGHRRPGPRRRAAGD